MNKPLTLEYYDEPSDNLFTPIPPYQDGTTWYYIPGLQRPTISDDLHLSILFDNLPLEYIPYDDLEDECDATESDIY